MGANRWSQFCGHAGSAVLAVALVLPFAGCTTIGVRSAEHGTLADEICAIVTDDGRLTAWTADTLKRHDLADRYRRAPASVLTSLQALADKNPEPDTVFALAEISYALGRGADRWGDERAGRYQYLCAGYAYHYLFDGTAADAFDPRYR